MGTKSEEKQYSLKNTEKNLIGNCNARHNAELLDIMSYIAIERLNYNVTKQTQFRIDEEGNMYITEIEETKEEVETA